MSDSDDLSTPADLPPDAEIEQCLRRVVRDAIKQDEEITIKIARTRAETELALESGFLKDNEQWKPRSKDLINAAVQDPASPEQPKKSAPKPKLAAKAGTKRKSDETQPKKKRQKKSASPVLDSEDDEESVNGAAQDSKASEPAEVNSEVKAQPKNEEDSALSEPPEDESEPAELKTNGKPTGDDHDDSDLSSLIDDPPPKKKRQKKSTSPSDIKAKPKIQKSSKAKPDKPDLSPDEEEIKRLQSWLLKCGIRKLWWRELVPYDTAKEKIKHLKGMLEDVGLTGRYSVEKARGD